MTSLLTSLLPLWAWPIVAAVAAYLLRRPILAFLTPRTLPGIPALPNPSPLLGDLPEMSAHMAKSRSFSTYFDSVARRLGPIAQIRISFFERFVMISDYQEIEAILNNHAQFDRATNTIKMFSTILPQSQIALPTNKMWRHHRRIVGTSMTSKYLSQTTPKASEAIKNLVTLWQEKIKASGGKSFAAEHDFEATTMDSICGIAFGSTWGVVDKLIEQSTTCATGKEGDAVFDQKRPAIADSFMAIFESVPQLSFLPSVAHFLRHGIRPSYRQHRKRLYDFFLEKVTASRAQAKLMGGDEAVETITNTLDMMVARELRGEDWMPDSEMMDELYLYLLAGTETTASTMAWGIKYLTANPDIQRKLREHILSRTPELQDRQPTYEDLNAANLPYLEAVVHETLRLARVAGGYTREAKEDVVILGKVVPKGSIILMLTTPCWEDETTPAYGGPGATAAERGKSIESVRSDKSSRKVGYWKAGTAKQFMPERWLDAEGNFDLNAGPSLPFSWGQRGCFGKSLALNLAFFFAPLPDNLNSFANYETVANRPRQCFVRPVAWTSSESSKQ